MTQTADPETTTYRTTSFRPPRPGLALLVGQFGYDVRAQLRNPSSIIFTLALPVLFLVAFTATSDDASSAAEYYVPATMVLALASGTLTNLAVTLTYLREFGQLKRVLVTPLPRWVYLGSRMGAGIIVAGGTVVCLGLIGMLAFDVTPAFPLTALAAMTMTFLLGSALGVAATVVIRSETAAAPLANAICLPLLMASGVFFPLDRVPEWFADIADWLPFSGVVQGATEAYAGDAAVSELMGEILWVPGLWTLGAVLLAVRFFRWAPQKRR